MTYKNLLIAFVMCVNLLLSAQEKHPHIEPQPKEVYQFRIHYGFLNAVDATLSRTEEVFQGQNVSHVIGTGSTTGLARLFLRVDDTYESYYTNDFKPQFFKRSVVEGGYSKEEAIEFDYSLGIATATDYTNNQTTVLKVVDDLQDLMSFYFYLKSTINPSNLTKGAIITIPILFDSDGIHNFKITYEGTEIINTAFGAQVCYKFKPFIDFGSRVFGNHKNFWVWISKDQLLPVKVKAPLVVGSITVDLESYTLQ